MKVTRRDYILAILPLVLISFILILALGAILTTGWYIIKQWKKAKKQSTFAKCLKDMKEVLDDNNMRFFLTCGTLLGQRREGKFIDYDEDIDVGIFAHEYNSLIKDAILNSGKFNLKAEYGDFKQGHYELSFKHIQTNVMIDLIFYFKQRGENNYMSSSYTGDCDKEPIGYCRWKSTIRGLKQSKFLNEIFLVPSNTDEFLKDLYGDDFLTPKSFTYHEGIEKGHYKNKV